MEDFLSSNGVQYEHHDLATDQQAREYLDSRGIKSVPVTIVDDDEVIIGYYPKKLVPALSLNIKVDLSGKTTWLSDKYDRILTATVGATRQLTDAQLEMQVSWRPQTLRSLFLHVLSFPELAWLSHEHGSMSTEDMRASNERLKDVASVEAIAAYGEGVRDHIKAFLATGDTEAFDRVVPAHYGGEVTVLELLNIILSHSTHHLKQAYWFLEEDGGGLGLKLQNRATEDDLAGITTPEALI
ncbi:MAG: hypothetical protein BZY88_18840 [SAR202 cluster bacterium Io17-Chloro-G9]|nr:MAG: hypothetical protein BZY88_18840 [SAR202 cluster bacterium Io17-Chloro-G9]